MQQNISENAFYNRIKAIVDLKNISQNMFDQSVEFTPVDLLAQALVKLVQIPETDIMHSLIIIEKIRQTPTKYPRGGGKPRKNPL